LGVGVRDESWSIVGEFVPCVFNCVSFLRTVDYTLLKRTFFQVYSEQPLFHPLYFFILIVFCFVVENT